MVGYIYDPGALGGGSKLLPYGFALPLILIGIYLIVPVFRRCNYLLVHTQSGKRKLTVKEGTVSEIVTAARVLGYPIIERTEP